MAADPIPTHPVKQPTGSVRSQLSAMSDSAESMLQPPNALMADAESRPQPPRMHSEENLADGYEQRVEVAAVQVCQAPFPTFMLTVWTAKILVQVVC